MKAEQQLRAFVSDLRQQIGIAEDAGAEHNDLCIVVPSSYLTFAGGWPAIDLDGQTVALVPKLWARDMADTAVGEMGFAGPADNQHLGVWA
jgi:hypothetical protein